MKGLKVLIVDAEQVLIQLFELCLAIVEGKLFINRIGQLMKLFIIGRIPFPLRLFDKGVDDFLQ